jgi:anti-sigma factor ChrR (cupin superfamily)
MTDRVSEHQMKELAALHALSALSQFEARAFEQHIAGGCEVCGAELESFEQTVSELAFSAPAAEPSSTLRDELIARVGAPDPVRMGYASRETGADQFVSILALEGEWREIQEGVRLKKLYVDQKTGIATSLVRMLPGTALPVHQHLGVEQFFVIEGDCNVAGQKLGPGAYHRAEAGSTHETTYTTGGTLFLLIAPERYAVLDAR